MIRYVKVKKNLTSLWDFKIKIDVVHELDTTIAIRFLSTTTFCCIGYYKWYLKDDFLNIFEFID